MKYGVREEAEGCESIQIAEAQKNSFKLRLSPLPPQLSDVDLPWGYAELLHLQWPILMDMKAADAYSKRALSIGGFKDALLYFDEVVPLMGSLEFLLSHIFLEHPKSQKVTPRDLTALLLKVILQSLPPHLRNEQFMRRLLAVHQITLMLFESGLGDSPEAEKLKGKEYELSGLPICTFPEVVRPSQESADIALSIASLRLVDTEDISYEQLLEFRNDYEAQEKLRRLRLFAYENYQAKPRSFIEDDLMARISDYESTVKKWGFETKAAVLTALMDSKLVAGGVAGSFLSAYMNQPLVAVASAAGASGLAIGRIAIEIGKRRFELQKVMAENPVSYITYMKDKLGEEK